MDLASLQRELAREREALAREREARAAADSRAEALRAQLALLHLGEAGAAQGGGDSQPTTAPIPSQLSVPFRVLQSPSAKAESIIDDMFCAVVERKIVMLHQFVKKTDKTPPKELALARKRMKEWKDVDT